LGVVEQHRRTQFLAREAERREAALERLKLCALTLERRLFVGQLRDWLAFGSQQRADDFVRVQPGREPADVERRVGGSKQSLGPRLVQGRAGGDVQCLG
jgi:hypothetical protein